MSWLSILDMVKYRSLKQTEQYITNIKRTIGEGGKLDRIRDDVKAWLGVNFTTKYKVKTSHQCCCDVMRLPELRKCTFTVLIFKESPCHEEFRQ